MELEEIGKRIMQMRQKQKELQRQIFYIEVDIKNLEAIYDSKKRVH